MKEVKIVVKMNNLVSDEGDSLTFNIPFNRLIGTTAKALHEAANNETPLRLYAANAFTSMSLLIAAMNDKVEPIEEHKKVETPVKKKRNYRGRVCGMRPTDAVLLNFQENGFTYKKVADMYGVVNSTVSNWYTAIKKKGSE